ncbi:MAG: endonuclease MutS2 [Clostridia bacterium]|nr:endonuclease MutS2 [Clostridia bacterium]
MYDTITTDTFLQKSRRTLELDKVCAKLASFAVTDAAKQAALELTPSGSIREVRRLSDETSAAFELSCRKGSPSFSGVKDITPLILRAERGGILSPAELLTVAALFRSARFARDYRFRDRDDADTCIDEYFSLLRPDYEFERSITDAILSEDEIADTASTELLTIRRKLSAAQNRVRDILARIISGPNASKILQESLITQRSGRYVVPVKAEHKASVPGMVHDVSSSGATIFIEPMAVVEANNEISELLSKERNEIERILAQFSASVFARRDALLASYRMLCTLDLIFARAKLATDLDARPAIINEEGRFELIKARHPLLDQKKVVPINVSLGIDYDTLIVTGPNTGGKTVSLKTLGLLTLMAQCGLHIPAAQGSTVSLCPAVYADIGDEQSIEQSLSTFSSHMTNIVEILSRAEENCLILFDELGAGTDPTEGAALAIAIIERASSLGAKIAATTHYAELKVYALSTPNVENASCEFDIETLRPTYRLLTGIPGRSNAFAISKRLGLSDDIIEHAHGLIGQEASRFEDVITQLERNRQKAEEEQARVEALRREIEQLTQRARDRERQLAAEKAKAEAAAREEAMKIVEETREESRAILADLRRMYAMAQGELKSININEDQADINRRLNAMDSAAAVSESDADVPETVVIDRPLKIGDHVLVEKMGIDGIVAALPGKDGKLQIQAGAMKIRAKLDEVRLCKEAPKTEQTSKRTRRPVSAAEAQKVLTGAIATGVTNRLDIRGEASDGGIHQLDQYLDNAIRAHLTEVTIVHGKGTGKLRDAVRSHLRHHRHVKSFRPGIYGEGEDGVTIVLLN